MISILIPTYNYNVYPLVSELCNQATQTDKEFEIIVVDDASSQFLAENEKISELDKVRLIRLTQNKGRTAARGLLADKASYSSLLFLDSDVMPVNSSFLSVYLNMSPNKGIVFGGIEYETEIPPSNNMLRWKYGHNRESLSLDERNKNKYETINSGCFLINRSVFLSINNRLQKRAYGMDLLFKQILGQENVIVNHIKNPVYHLGLESNKDFLKKSLSAIDTTVSLEQEQLLLENQRPIQRSYTRLKNWRLAGLFMALLFPFKGMMVRNFLSSSPSLLCFDLYRLNYYIELKSKKSA